MTQFLNKIFGKVASHSTSSLVPRPSSLKRGSALLIVLGMMAFMVVSAVAFSMFMRQSRLPSSFLRQRLLAAQLVKAGLAGAMQRLDAGIGDNPYPGIGNTGLRPVEFKTKDGSRQRINYGNYWHHRVFLESQMANDRIGDNDEDALDFEPVSTLTLEALAYLPPPLVNTVRYWSKRTSTASWQSLGYDAGRYAFTAVNVSDYFDINRIRANAMRDSSPENRISLGYLFEDEGKGGDKAAAFDTFMAKVTNDVFRTGLVSLADYNMALQGNKGTPFASPFCQYVANPPGDGTYYGGTADDAKRQKFVTGSWYPGIMDGETDEVYLTDDANGQPFDGIKQSLDTLTDEGIGNKAFDILRRRLDICTLGALYDYVDEDDIPISLAIPTVERVPMLTGISIAPEGFEVKLAAPDKFQNPPTQPAPGKTVTETIYTWKIDKLGDDPKIRFSGSGVFPFKHKKSRNGERTSYPVEVYARVFLSTDDKFANDTRCKEGVSVCPPNANWKDETALMGNDKAYLSLVGSGTATVNAAPTTEDQAVFDIKEIKMDIPPSALQGAHVYGIKKIETVEPDGFGGTKTTTTYDYCSDQMSKPLLYHDGSSIKDVKAVGKKGPKLYLCCACRVRILGEDDRTVDMVPAMIADDKDYTGHDSAGRAGDNAKLCGEKEPMLPICSAAAVVDLDKYADFETAAKAAAPGPVEQPTGVDLGALNIFCEDPRYNWAPEDWYKTDGEVRGANWLQNVQTERGTRGSRDIFQFVSDADYLQSMGELQFLPYIRSFRQDANPYSGTYFSSTKYDGRWHTSANLANKDYLWQTHWSFGRGNRSDRSEGEEADPHNWGISDTNGGVAVSPYADKDLMMAAIANTPYDWYMASGYENLTLNDGRKYCFGPASSETGVKWDELLKVADGIKARVGQSTDWEQELFLSTKAGEEWDKEDGPFGADFGDNFHDVDRKFLYSYWRSCFANTQQLFLIFVRAEPAVMGGSSAGHTPSQLGARAVALVWREPESSISDESSDGGASSHPHRMRILFYHQFD